MNSPAAPSEYTDLEIYIRPAKSALTEDSSRHDIEAKIDGAGLWRDETILDESLLSPFEDEPREYGERLRQQLFAGRIAAAYDRALGTGGRKVRVRLLLDAIPDRRHWFRWERMFVGDEPISTSPLTPFSRYLLDESTAPLVPDDGIFHLIVALANPSNLPAGLAAVDVVAELRALALAFRDINNRSLFRLAVMPGRAILDAELLNLLKEIGAKVVSGPVTFEAIKLESQSADGLHIVAHGKFIRKEQKGFLYVENEAGELDRVDDERLGTLRNGNLKLVYLQACESGARASSGPKDPNEASMVGVAARLMAAGIPAVVAMQQPVEMGDARLMTRAFYQSLVKDGAVDVAVNAGRQAVQSLAGDRWSVPALYMRLRDGRLWHADPFREALRRSVAKWECDHDMKTPVPLQATKEEVSQTRVRGGTYDVTELALSQLRDDKTRMIILAGNRGAGKSAVLDRVAWTLGKEFLEKDGVLLPVRFALGDLAGHADLLRFVEQRLRTDNGGSLTFADDLAQQLRLRNLVLMVNGEEDVVPARRADFVRALERLPAGVRLVLSVDSLALDDWLSDDLHGGNVYGGLAKRGPSILRMEPMDRALVTRYLNDLEESTAVDGKAQEKQPETLAEKIQRNRWWDLASESWMLRRMIRYRDVRLSNRAELLGRVIAERLGQLELGNVTLSCAEQALAAIAWRLQQTQKPALTGGPLYEELADARRGREFPLAEIKTALIRDCEVLRRSGEDGVRFAYAGFQAYFAALSLLRDPDRERKLDDIVATLGSVRHLRLWSETLVILAGMMDDFGSVLGRILAGSSSASSDQVYLAVRCYLEIPDARRGPRLSSLMGLLVDTLIWRSHPINDRPIVDRKMAVKWLTEIKTEMPPEQDRAIEHLVNLACDKISKDWSGKPRYEFSGLRIEALNVMLARREDVTKYILANRPDLTPILRAIGELIDNHNPAPMIHVMNRSNSHESPLAVFALGLSGRNDVVETLLVPNLNPEMNPEVRWAIAEMLPRLDPQQTLDKAIRPFFDQEPDSRVVYMINKVGRVEKDIEEYLDRCLASNKPRVIGRTIRTLADLGDPTMKELCEHTVRADWAALRGTGRVTLHDDPNGSDTQSLQHAALEGLRTVGDMKTVEVLQKAWLKLSPPLSQLSYDIVESIYWRLGEQKTREVS